MHPKAYAAVEAAREEFGGLVEAWSAQNPYLLEAEERLREKQGYGDYRVETPVVYNRALDDIEIDDEIKIILVADNPGKKEQLAANNRYLVGQSGKLAEGWFKRELGIDFRREVLILNKTPVHTPKTAELALLRAKARGSTATGSSPCSRAARRRWPTSRGGSSRVLGERGTEAAADPLARPLGLGRGELGRAGSSKCTATSSAGASPRPTRRRARAYGPSTTSR